MPDPISWSHAGPYLAAALLAGYLVGSVPFGLILTRLAGHGDVRKIGSGNIGATNVLRTGRRGLALATLLLDGGKGAAAVVVAHALYGPDMAVSAGVGALFGHLFPVWLRFKGGKGVATALGILLAGSWPVGALACLTWLVMAAVFRYSSLAALASLAAAPVYAKLLGDYLGVHLRADLGTLIGYHQLAEVAVPIAVMVWLRHWGNIRRLATGREPKIGGQKPGAGQTSKKPAK